MAKSLSGDGLLQWCVPVQNDPLVPVEGVAVDRVGDGGCNGAGCISGGYGNSSGTEVTAENDPVVGCTTWEELKSAAAKGTRQLRWPLAGIALHAPSLKGVTAAFFIKSMGSMVFDIVQADG